MREKSIGKWGVLVCLLMGSCGGGSSSITSPGGGPPGGGPPPTGGNATSGEYLFEGNSLPGLNVATIDSSTGALGSPTLAGDFANNLSLYPGIALAPSNHFLYAFYTSFTLIQGFQVAGPGLQLNTLVESPFFPATSGFLTSMAIHPTGNFLYVIELPATIEEFSVDITTGNLTHASTLTETADLRMAVIDPGGKFLFVTDLTGGRIFAYQIDHSNGSLSTVAGSPFIVPANGQPSVDAIDSSGSFLYASLMSGGVAAFAINSSTGVLADIPGSPFPTGSETTSIVIAPSGKFMYASDTQDGLIDGFAIDPISGALSGIMGSPFSTVPAPSSVVVDPSGKFLYALDSLTSTIYGFSLDSSSGSLSTLTGSPFASVPNPINISAVNIP